jgi:hypothetical protein
LKKRKSKFLSYHKGWRICGENLFAVHSITYDNLKTYFYVFSIWNEKNECLSVKETKEWCELLDLQYVPILFEGIWDEKYISSLHETLDRTRVEGYVVRISEHFLYADFKISVSKWVRKGHVTSDEHWMHKKIEKNLLKI